MKETNTQILVIRHSCYTTTSQIITMVIKLRTQKWEQHVARIGEMRNARRVLVSTYEGKGARGSIVG